MVKVDTKHKLSGKEVYTLRQLIGKTLIDIHSSREDMNIESKVINVLDPVNLIFKEFVDFIVISAEFYETNFGEDFIKINIDQSGDLIGIKRSDQYGLKMPPLNLKFLPEFKISKIEVYGRSYFCESENTQPNWQIEIDNPGQKIIENIDTENTLLFYSGTKRLLIKPHGPVPWMTITNDIDLIAHLLIDKDLNGKAITIMKHEIE